MHSNDILDNDFENLDAVKQWLLDDLSDLAMPESLNSKNLMHLLEKESALQEQSNAQSHLQLVAKKSYVRWAAYAACICMAVFGVMRFTSYQSADDITESAPADAPMAAPIAAGAPMPDPPQADNAQPMAFSAAAPAQQERFQATPAAQQPVAQSYQQLVDQINLGLSSSSSNVAMGRSAMNPSTAGAGALASAPAMRNDVLTGGGAVSSTNIQVQNVDEGDIIKTDGQYIYTYGYDREEGKGAISIVGATNLKRMATIELNETQTGATELYLNGQTLIAICQSTLAEEEPIRKQLAAQAVSTLTGTQDLPDVIIPEYLKEQEFNIPLTKTFVYDITNKQNPTQSHSLVQDGRYVSSRLSDGVLYLVTQKSTPYTAIGAQTRAVQAFPFTAEDGQASLLEPARILLPPAVENMQATRQSYTVVSSTNVMDDCKTATKAVLGSTGTIMMTPDSLYLASSLSAQGEPTTGLVKFVVTPSGLDYVSSATVAGRIDGQFALDEYNGNLRVATTYLDSASRKNQSGVFVLDQQLKPLGEITGLAPGESIKSVRFIENTGYVVTFRQTDPLFVLDLSNPSKPVLKGELKIPGFSEYLHPIDENTLLGFGVNTTVNPSGNVIEDGLKLSLFDVSNPMAPTEKANLLIGNRGSSSEALRNHKAVLYHPDKKLFGFPATIYSVQDAQIAQRKLEFSGYLLFSIVDAGFQLEASLSSNNEAIEGLMRQSPNNIIERGLYIGETFYTTGPDAISAYAMNEKYKQIGELKL